MSAWEEVVAAVPHDTDCIFSPNARHPVCDCKTRDARITQGIEAAEASAFLAGMRFQASGALADMSDVTRGERLAAFAEASQPADQVARAEHAADALEAALCDVARLDKAEALLAAGGWIAMNQAGTSVMVSNATGDTTGSTLRDALDAYKEDK